jgi:hypothetical protein
VIRIRSNTDQTTRLRRSSVASAQARGMSWAMRVASKIHCSWGASSATASLRAQHVELLAVVHLFERARRH